MSGQNVLGLNLKFGDILEVWVASVDHHDFVLIQLIKVQKSTFCVT